MIPASLSSFARFEAGDFNGDAKKDLAIVTGQTNPGCGFPPGTQLRILFGDGAGVFSAPTPNQFNGAVRTLVAEDVNGDGVSDLVLVDGCTKDLLVLTGNLAGSFSAGTPFTAGLDPQRIVFADLSGDGKPDLIVENQRVNDNPNTILVLTASGTGAFSLATSLVTESSAASIGVADYDGNGHLDVTLGPSGEKHLGVFLNACPVGANSSIQFNASTYSVGEATTQVDVTVTRSGDTSGTSTVDYITTDTDNFTVNCGEHRGECFCPLRFCHECRHADVCAR